MSVRNLLKLQRAVSKLEKPLPAYLAKELVKPAQELLDMPPSEGWTADRIRFEPEELYWQDPEYPNDRSQIRRRIRGPEWGALVRCRVENLRAHNGRPSLKFRFRWGQDWDAWFSVDPEREDVVHWESWCYPPGKPCYWLDFGPEEPESERFPSFRPLFVGYQHQNLFNGPSEELFTSLNQCLESCPHPEKEILALLGEENWRASLVGGFALLEHGVFDGSLKALWTAFDSDSKVGPQLSVVLALLDPEMKVKARKRLLSGGLSRRCWCSLCWYLALTEEGRDWMLARFSLEEIMSQLLTFSRGGAEGVDNANDWYAMLRQIRPEFDLGEPLAGWRPARGLARMWVTSKKMEGLICPGTTIEALVADYIDVHNIFEPLFQPFLAKGEHSLELQKDRLVGETVSLPLEPGLRDVIAAHLPAYPHWREGNRRQRKRLPSLRMSNDGDVIHLRIRPRKRLEAHVNLSRDLLQNAGTEAVCYGASDTGDMRGGVPLTILQSCGSKVQDALRTELARETSVEIGEVFVTEAYEHQSADWVAHIVALKRGERTEAHALGAGVFNALRRLDCYRVHSVAFSTIATGRDRPEPRRVAAEMIKGARRFFEEVPESTMQVLFCMPDLEDYEVFEAAMGRVGV